MSGRIAKRVLAVLLVAVGAMSILFLCPGSLAETSLAAQPTPVAAASTSQSATAEPSVADATPEPPTPDWRSPIPSAPPTPAPTSTPRPQVLAEVNPMPSVGTAFPSDSLTEPTVAVSPFDPKLVAVIYQRTVGSSTCGIDTGIRISHDGGRTWQNATGRPWRGTGRGPNYHGVIAWGPGPVAGSSRLWWADTTVPHCDYSKHSLTVSYSDTFGRTWSPLYVERRTPPWIGGFPDITVDCNIASPNYGTVYVAYNWLADPIAGPGLAVLASSDGGRSWQIAQVPPVGLAGYPAAWRIGYRIRTAPDGSAYVAFYEANMLHWNKNDPFASGGLTNVGRVGFGVARLRYHRATHQLAAEPAVWARSLPRNGTTVSGAKAPGTTNVLSPDPRWQIGLDVDQATGRVFLAVSTHLTAPAGGDAHGQILVGRSDDGLDWHWSSLSALPDFDGLPQSAFKPTLAARNGLVFVGFHGLTDVQRGARTRASVGTYYAVSYDDGELFTAPARVTRARWYPSTLAADVNGAGLRERADIGSDGIARYAYGDGRLAATYPGRSAVFVALVDLGLGS
jgi:hypothetical protein